MTDDRLQITDYRLQILDFRFQILREVKEMKEDRNDRARLQKTENRWQKNYNFFCIFAELLILLQKVDLNSPTIFQARINCRQENAKNKQEPPTIQQSKLPTNQILSSVICHL